MLENSRERAISSQAPRTGEGSETILRRSRNQEVPKRPAGLQMSREYEKIFFMWNRRYERCVVCERTDRPHMAKGKCRYCYLSAYRAANLERVTAQIEAWRQRNFARLRILNKLKREEEHFSGKREAVLKRDGYCCTECGSKKQLVVHHKDGNGRGSKRPNNSMRNLQTLCRRCHQRVHRVLDRWARDFDQCRRCGTTERTHNAKGFCWKCYSIVHGRSDDMVRASARTEEP